MQRTLISCFYFPAAMLFLSFIIFLQLNISISVINWDTTQENINPTQVFNPYAMSSKSLDAEIEIYRSKDTINDVIESLSQEFPKSLMLLFSDKRKSKTSEAQLPSFNFFPFGR